MWSDKVLQPLRRLNGRAPLVHTDRQWHGLGGREFFATTRTDNVSMIRIVRALDFVRVGTPYPQRNEQLVLFLRSCPTFVAAPSQA